MRDNPSGWPPEYQDFEYELRHVTMRLHLAATTICGGRGATEQLRGLIHAEIDLLEQETARVADRDRQDAAANAVRALRATAARTDLDADGLRDAVLAGLPTLAAAIDRIEVVNQQRREGLASPEQVQRKESFERLYRGQEVEL